GARLAGLVYVRYKKRGPQNGPVTRDPLCFTPAPQSHSSSAPHVPAKFDAKKTIPYRNPCIPPSHGSPQPSLPHPAAAFGSPQSNPDAETAQATNAPAPA